MYPIALVIGLIISPALAIEVIPHPWERFDVRCPSTEVQTVTNLNHTQFQGSWYVIQRYMDTDHTACTYVNYQWIESARTFSQTIYSRSATGGKSTYYGHVTEREAFPNGGHFYMNFNRKEDFYFVDTDYSNYAVVWGCENVPFPKGSVQNVMILSKDRFFDVNSLEALNATLNNNPIDRTRLRQIDHEHVLCQE